MGHYPLSIPRINQDLATQINADRSGGGRRQGTVRMVSQTAMLMLTINLRLQVLYAYVIATDEPLPPNHSWVRKPPPHVLFAIPF